MESMDDYRGDACKASASTSSLLNGVGFTKQVIGKPKVESEDAVVVVVVVKSLCAVHFCRALQNS